MLELFGKAIKNRSLIVEGLKNRMLDASGFLEEDKALIFDQRRKVCNQCPLNLKGRCNERKVISTDLEVTDFNRETMELVELGSGNPKEHYLTKDHKKVYRGCGCFLQVKQKSEQSFCPAGLWGGEFGEGK